MLIKILAYLFISINILIADVNVNLVLSKDNSSYIISDGDIVLKNDKLRFSIKSDKDTIFNIYYNTKNEKQLLFSKNLEKDKQYHFPSGNQYLVIDEKDEILNFSFDDSKNVSQLSLYSNPQYKESFISEKSSLRDERKYIDYTKVISNSRGETESNIIIPKLESVTTIIKVDDSIGAGVFIENGKYILTNYHVIETNEDYIYVAIKPELGNNPSKNSYYKVAVKKVDMLKDLALLETPKELLENFKINSLSLASEQSLKKGMDIYNMGHPLGYYFAFEKGMLSNILNDYTWTTHKADYVLQYSMNSNQGNSGGPVINDKLELVGIGAFSNTTGKNLNFAISVVDIKNFIDSKESVRIKKTNPNDYNEDIVEKGLYQNMKLAKLDRNKNGIPDAMMKDIDDDGIWDIIAYDTNEDGIYERMTSFK